MRRLYSLKQARTHFPAPNFPIISPVKALLNNLAFILVGILTGGLIWLVSIPPRGAPVTLRPPPTPAPLLIHVAGAVAAPGVYELPQDGRVRDAVSAAGGFLTGADPAGLNLAEKLIDGQQVIAPTIVPTPGREHAESAPAPGSPGRLVNINTATLPELQALPGIGPSIAQRIIDHREQKGAFQKIVDIIKVTGIGPSTFEKIKDRITTER